MSLLEENRKKLYELQPWTHYAAEKWLQECFDKGLEFRITETYRPQARQNKLYAQGRTAPGPIVTWTLNSLHTRRLAADVYPTKVTYEEIAEIAEKYGITHPLPFDKPHFQFDKCITEPKPQYSVEAQIKRLTRAIARSSGAVRATLRRALERLYTRISK